MKNLNLIIMLALLAFSSCSKEEVEEIVEESTLSRNDVQQQLSSGTSVKSLLNQGVRTDSLYGLDYQGGYIFSINEADGTGMVISKSNVGSYPNAPEGRDLWTPTPHSQLNVTSTGMGTGMTNTSKIVEAVGNGSYAANSCFSLNEGSYDDWYLPSVDELEAFYKNMQEKGFSDIPSSSNTFSFWSSTEVDDQKAKAVTIKDGNLFIYDSFKSSANFVRAVRNFN